MSSLVSTGCPEKDYSFWNIITFSIFSYMRNGY